MNASNLPSHDGLHHINEVSHGPAQAQSITRRDFVGGIAKLIAIGALSHFGLLAGKALAGETDCDCASEDSNDWCPYGGDGDKCDPGKGNEDMCRTEADTNDECKSGLSSEDLCTSGQAPADNCGEKDGKESGDECHGGGDKTGGQEQDQCNPDLQDSDKCNDGGLVGGNDSCRENENGESSDWCNVGSDDTCYGGTDDNGLIGIGAGTGEKDWCTGTKLSTDACHDGSEAQDSCLGEGNANGKGDECTSGATDDCGKKPGDTDKCYGGAQPDDSCTAGAQDDVCQECEDGSDECRPGRESDDRDDKGGSRG